MADSDYRTEFNSGDAALNLARTRQEAFDIADDSCAATHTSSEKVFEGTKKIIDRGGHVVGLEINGATVGMFAELDGKIANILPDTIPGNTVDRLQSIAKDMIGGHADKRGEKVHAMSDAAPDWRPYEPEDGDGDGIDTIDFLEDDDQGLDWRPSYGDDKEDAQDVPDVPIDPFAGFDDVGVMEGFSEVTPGDVDEEPKGKAPASPKKKVIIALVALVIVIVALLVAVTALPLIREMRGGGDTGQEPVPGSEIEDDAPWGSEPDGPNSDDDHERTNRIGADEKVDIEIPEGTNATGARNICERAGLGGLASGLEDALNAIGAADSIKPGTYTVLGDETAEDFAQRLSEGRTAPYGFVDVKAGMTVTQISTMIRAANGDVKQQDFDEAMSQIANDKTGGGFDMLYKANIDGSPVGTLEGYITPGTYDMRGKGADSLIQEMLQPKEDAFEEKVTEASKFHDALVVASIVEKETTVDSERPYVASMIYNRMSHGMFLNMESTVLYAIPSHNEGEPLTDVEKNVDSPYNTFKHMGLPPTPICAVSPASLDAALNPPQTTYLFFLKLSDGTHAFASSIDEFKKQVADMQAGRPVTTVQPPATQSQTDTPTATTPASPNTAPQTQPTTPAAPTATPTAPQTTQQVQVEDPGTVITS